MTASDPTESIESRMRRLFPEGVPATSSQPPAPVLPMGGRRAAPVLPIGGRRAGVPNPPAAAPIPNRHDAATVRNLRRGSTAVNDVG